MGNPKLKVGNCDKSSGDKTLVEEEKVNYIVSRAGSLEFSY
jgi:hypothetical protein